jgi:ABC-type branched-subunit amino acid transport system ATPase component
MGNMSASHMLVVSGLCAGYVPGVEILSSISLVAAENAVTLVIGPNGAGKSTLLRVIFGLLKPSTGRVVFRGKDVTGANPSTLKAIGVSYVTQDINSFPLLTVEENLLMGAWVFRRDGPRLARQLEQVYAMFPVLKDKRRDRAGSLSGGQGRMLSIARELMTSPSLLLIDEPTVGLAPDLVGQVYGLLNTARSAAGAAILLVEQNIEQALPLADHLYLLNLGQVKAQGPGREFDNSRVRALVQECLLG